MYSTIWHVHLTFNTVSHSTWCTEGNKNISVPLKWNKDNLVEGCAAREICFWITFPAWSVFKVNPQHAVYMSVVLDFTEVHLVKYCTKEQLLGIKHFHLMLFYRSTPCNFGGKYCMFYSITHINQIILSKVKPPSSMLSNWGNIKVIKTLTHQSM